MDGFMTGQTAGGVRVNSLMVTADYGFSGKSNTGHGFPSTAPEMELSSPRLTEQRSSDALKPSEPSKGQSPADPGDLKKVSDPSENQPSAETGQQGQESESKIHVRKLVQWRAKLPKAEPSKTEPPRNSTTTIVNGVSHGTDKGSHVETTDCSSHEGEDIENGLPKQRGPGIWRRFTHGHDNDITDPLELTESSEVTLHWHIDETKERKDEGKTTFGIYVNTKSTGESQKDRLMWHHNRSEIKSLELMDKLVGYCKRYSLPEDEDGLALRLLRRVKNDAQREFINGSFLVPYVHRYDGQHVSPDQKDTSCLFINFPYVCLRKSFARQLAAKRGDDQHPVRTLLQSKFRLSKTTERDKQQSLKCLDTTELGKACELPEGSPYSRMFNDDSRVTEKVYVPQLWAMILGGGTMITNAPLSEGALRGTLLSRNESKGGLSMIRIRAMLGDEGYTYPLDQCNSWFGLIKKQREVVRRLREKESDEKQNSEMYAGFLLYVDARLEKPALDDPKKRTLLSSQNWGQELEKWKDRETLDLVLERRPAGIKSGNEAANKLTVPPDTKPSISRFSSTTPQGNFEEWYTPFPGHAAFRWYDFKAQAELPTVPPFLEWPILDQFGEEIQTDCRRKYAGAKRFLASILREPDSNTSYERQEPNINVTHHDGYMTPLGNLNKLEFAPLSLEELEKMHRKRDPSTKHEYQTGSEASIHLIDSNEQRFNLEAKFIGQCKNLLAMFVCRDMFNEDIEAIRLFWGAVRYLLFGEVYSEHISDRGLRDSDLSSFIHIFSGISWHAHQLRAGVHRTILHIGGEDFPQNSKQGLVLLETMVSALKAIFCLLFRAAREVKPRKGSVNSIFRPDPSQSASMEEAKLACKLLDTAREELIHEADGKALKWLGSTVTPEAIMTILMNRLSQGVFEDGSVDFVELYEQCLQKLTEAVEGTASRRLLKKINFFQEEIDIICGILREQDKVLSDFDELLNFQSYDNPNPSRRERYAGEHAQIDRVRTDVKERIAFCRELSERSRRLALQNVELVEASADRSSRAIVLFTMVTIIFLPLTFVAGFFGMNISGMNATLSHFWKIAGGTTAGVVVFTISCLIWSETVLLWAGSLPRKAVRLWRWILRKMSSQV